MPYLSWSEGTLLVRHALESDCVLGRDASLCGLIRPTDLLISRRHAAIVQMEGHWWLRDLESENGTLLNALPVSLPSGSRLQDGDLIQIGSWELLYTEGFPGLDGVQFAERVGNLFEEVRPEPAQAMVLIRGMELLQRSVEALLQEGTSETLIQGFLTEALRLLRADRGFVVMVESDGTWRRVVHIGDTDIRVGLSQTILQYVAAHRTAILSNVPMADPRFQGPSVADMHSGALMCAPMALDGVVLGILYLDRMDTDRPFSRFDLALFQAFVRLGAVALRHTQLAQGAMGQAETRGELLRTKHRVQAWQSRNRNLLMEMGGCLRWIQALRLDVGDPGAGVLTAQLDRLFFLVEQALRDDPLEGPPPDVFGSSKVAILHRRLERAWSDLVFLREGTLSLEAAPEGEIWISEPLGTQSLRGLVEPMLMRLAPGCAVTGRWFEDGPQWALALHFPMGHPAPVPEPWTLQALAEAHVVWRWSDQTLTMALPMTMARGPETPEQPLFGLISNNRDIQGMFEQVAEATECALIVLEPEPPCAPLPPFRYLVMDFQELQDPVACLRAYRQHPGFAMVPILVIRAPEAELSELMAAGATDWLQEGFRWETLHHRLMVLKGHQELQRKALASERLDSFRQMAGTLKHEINNPLAVISMQVELLQRKYEGEPKLAKIAEMVDRIRALVQVLQRMREAPSEEYPGGGSILKLG